MMWGFLNFCFPLERIRRTPLQESHFFHLYFYIFLFFSFHSNYKTAASAKCRTCHLAHITDGFQIKMKSDKPMLTMGLMFQGWKLSVALLATARLCHFLPAEYLILCTQRVLLFFTDLSASSRGPRRNTGTCSICTTCCGS